MKLVDELHERQYGRLVAALVRMLGAHRLDWDEELAPEAFPAPARDVALSWRTAQTRSVAVNHG